VFNWLGRFGLDYLADDRDEWWTPVSVVLNVQVPQGVGNILTG
jgi:hypothetical protein